MRVPGVLELIILISIASSNYFAVGFLSSIVGVLVNRRKKSYNKDIPLMKE